MNFKIDTREKFTMITPVSDFIADNLTAEFFELIKSFFEKRVNLVISLKKVISINEQFIKQIAALKNEFYSKNISFVLCELTLPVTAFINQLDMDEVLNITSTETEAWDIVQIEEIERELMNDAK